jgi:hypothetical protein
MKAMESQATEKIFVVASGLAQGFSPAKNSQITKGL